MDYEIVELPAYRAIGLKWEGAYTEIPALRELIQEMNARAGELEHAVNTDIQLGLSYHLRPDGFVHYSVYEVGAKQQIPDGMREIVVKPMTYFRIHHHKGGDIGHTYAKIYQWMKENGEYTPLFESEAVYYDDLPIKHERYPDDRDLNDPHFDIYIPIKKK
ncbi:GyrI-like domain-containing protein [Rossellomorea sp. NS-SX7]|uniref:GyrI-like domain-containing protein n=1 Tax=Rossellomorea sp. NS-SX7 TaxID=3463856 RepID=UPI004057DC9A